MVWDLKRRSAPGECSLHFLPDSKAEDDGRLSNQSERGDPRTPVKLRSGFGRSISERCGCAAEMEVLDGNDRGWHCDINLVLCQKETIRVVMSVPWYFSVLSTLSELFR